MLPSEFGHHFQVQAHGSDAMVDEENCVFFLPHRPRSRITEPPFFLFMKGTGNGEQNILIDMAIFAQAFSSSLFSLFFPLIFILF